MEVAAPRAGPPRGGRGRADQRDRPLRLPADGLEQTLRRRGGETPYRNGFVDHYLTGRIYPHGADAFVQLLVAACIVVSYTHILTKWQRTRTPDVTAPV